MGTLTLNVIAVLLCAALFGGMAFFSFVFAPLVFSRLPEDTAGGFIRQVFPVYYLLMAVLAALAAMLLLPGDPVESALMLTVFLGFVFSRQFLRPRINRARDARLAGDESAAIRFRRLHGLSVVINMTLLALVVVTLVLLLT